MGSKRITIVLDYAPGMAELLTIVPIRPGQIECKLDLRLLFAGGNERRRFESKWDQFLVSDPANPDVYRLERDRLIYTSEELIPAKTDHRPPLLLVLGNPASHSVAAGMFFSFEANGREHRFWKDILQPAGILDLALDQDLSVTERNGRRRERLLSLDYNSPFRIGLTVFITPPSAASGPWSGIAGVRKLIGARAMKKLEAAERERLLQSARKFLAPGGAVAVFQKDAWNALRSAPDPPYNFKAVIAGRLQGKLAGMTSVPLCGVPPTRLSGPARSVLKQSLISRAVSV